MRKAFKKIWSWCKFIFWMIALIIYAVLYAAPMVMASFLPTGRLFGRK